MTDILENQNQHHRYNCDLVFEKYFDNSLIYFQYEWAN